MPSLLRLLCSGVLFFAALLPAQAQEHYPAKPIRLVVPTAPGGVSDGAARLLGQALSKSLGQAVVVENRPGAGGALAAQAVMAAPADGHTLLWTIASMSGLPAVQKTPPFQSLGDLRPVARVGNLTYAVFTHPDVPGRTLAEFVDFARAHPGAISYATGTLGDYMVSARFLKAAGIKAQQVPYKGGAQYLPDLLASRVQMAFGAMSTAALQQAREGKLHLLAVLPPRRSAAAPETPTLAEAGYASVSLPTWQAIFAPGGTPAAVVDLLAARVVAALADPALRAALEQLLLQVDPSTPQELAALSERDAQAWQAFVREYEIAKE